MAYSDDPHIRSAQELDDADERDRLEGWPLSEDIEQEALDELDAGRREAEKFNAIVEDITDPGDYLDSFER